MSNAVVAIVVLKGRETPDCFRASAIEFRTRGKDENVLKRYCAESGQSIANYEIVTRRDKVLFLRYIAARTDH